jgi:hypothetical protein
MKQVLILAFLFSISFSASADIEGSYEYSMEKYPQLTEFLNKNNLEGDYSLVNIEMTNDGIFSLGGSSNEELLLVNYITFNMSAINYGSILVKKLGDSFVDSNIELPSPRQVEYNGETYSLHKPEIETNEGSLFVMYRFSCKKPAEFLTAGSCSDGYVYNAKLNYTFKGGQLVLTSISIKI